MLEYDAQYAELQDVVRSVKERETHAVMVPCTKFGMFEGELAGGGDAELLVGIGHNYLVERDVDGAVEIIERRRDLLRTKAADAERNAMLMESRARMAETLDRSGGGLGTIGEDEPLVEDGRARIAKRKDGIVEITEVYEANDDEIASISTLAPSSQNDRVDAGAARGDLDDFIARLEAMEMNDDSAVASSSAPADDDADNEFDPEEDGGEPPTIECPEDFPKYERWKAKRDAKDKELRAAAERSRARAETERSKNEAEIRRKNPPLRETVIERKPGERSRFSEEPIVDVNRKLSRYQMKKLGLLE